MVTVLDDAGGLIESDQRALLRHVVQDGFGADIIFSAGTTGEWDRVDNTTRQAIISVCADEICQINHARERSAGGLGLVQSWAGVTAPSKGETLANLDLAIDCGVDAAVIAPLSIAGVADPVRFMARDVLLGSAIEHWNRFLMRGGQPVGVVAGPANALPREWARAWQVCRVGDEERMREVQRVVGAFRDATFLADGRCTIACLKRALHRDAVISSYRVAKGTPALEGTDLERFDQAYDEVKRLAKELIDPLWVTKPEVG